MDNNAGRKRDLAKRVFVLSCLLVVFGYGVAVGRYEIFPFRFIKLGRDSLTDVYAERETLLGIRAHHFLRRARYAGNGVTRLNKTETAGGITLLSGFFESGNEIRLITVEGHVIHRWPVKFYDIFKDVSHISPSYWVPKTNWNVEIQGALAERDGSIVFNFEQSGTVKLDRCGAVQWQVRRMTHHSVEESVDGGFWIPARRFLNEQTRHPLLKPPYYEDAILKISRDGTILDEFSLLELLFKNRLEKVFFANSTVDPLGTSNGEITHLNAVEELSPKIAKHFPEFAAGDLLISERNYNLVLVADPVTRRVKWHQSGPWIKQHDPDFEESGRISVFSNNYDNTAEGSILGGSTIIEVNPLTAEAFVRYGNRQGEHMYSEIRGRHQSLSNGNLLISESEAGRVFEVTSEGELVWEFINGYDASNVAIITDAIRYPESYFTVRDWSCP